MSIKQKLLFSFSGSSSCIWIHKAVILESWAILLFILKWQLQIQFILKQVKRKAALSLVNTTAFCSKIISRLNIANDSSWYCTEYSPNSSLACFRGILSLRSTQQWKNPKIPLTKQLRILSVFLSLKGMHDHALLACCSTQIFHI